MTRELPALHDAASPAGAPEQTVPAGAAGQVGPQPQLPIVSVVVVNYNYGRFLTDAVESIFTQTYARVECIVVDNASTDETPEILAGLRLRFPAMVVVQRARNDGQTPASLDGLAVARGAYVIFLDADDYLLPRCVETHVYAHLSLRSHVGFTSGDMVQLADDQLVVGTGKDANRYMRSGRRLRPKRVRPYAETPGWPSPVVAAGLAEKLHFVRPLMTHWIWSPTSGLCYRRDALRLFADNPSLQTLRTGTDLYFAFGCGGLSGSVLIDAPLFVYRIHGANIYTNRAQLDYTLNFGLGGDGDSNQRAQLYLVDHLVAKAPRFCLNLIQKLNLLLFLVMVDRPDPDASLPRWARGSRAAQAIVRHQEPFTKALGPVLGRLALVFFAVSLRSPEGLAAALPPSDGSRGRAPQAVQ